MINCCKDCWIVTCCRIWIAGTEEGWSLGESGLATYGYDIVWLEEMEMGMEIEFDDSLLWRCVG